MIPLWSDWIWLTAKTGTSCRMVQLPGRPGHVRWVTKRKRWMMPSMEVPKGPLKPSQNQSLILHPTYDISLELLTLNQLLPSAFNLWFCMNCGSVTTPMPSKLRISKAICSILCLSWPYRYWLSQNAVKGDFVFEKRTSVPLFRGDLGFAMQPYLVAADRIVGRTPTQLKCQVGSIYQLRLSDQWFRWCCQGIRYETVVALSLLTWIITRVLTPVTVELYFDVL